MRRHHPGIVIASGDEHRRITCPCVDIVIRGIGIERLEFLRVMRRSIVSLPTGTLTPKIEPQHIHHPHMRQNHAEQIRALHHTSTHQQSAVGTAFYGQPGGRGVVLGNEPFCCSNEVVENNLFVRANRLAMPSIAVFATAANVGQRKHPSMLHPHQTRRIKPRQDGNSKSSVSRQQSWIRAIQLQTFLMD